MTKEQIDREILKLNAQFRANPNGPQAYTILARISLLGKDRKNAK
jgi:hypothetical protein